MNQINSDLCSASLVIFCNSPFSNKSIAISFAITNSSIANRVSSSGVKNSRLIILVILLLAFSSLISGIELFLARSRSALAICNRLLLYQYYTTTLFPSVQGWIMSQYYTNTLHSLLCVESTLSPLYREGLCHPLYILYLQYSITHYNTIMNANTSTITKQYNYTCKCNTIHYFVFLMES